MPDTHDSQPTRTPRTCAIEGCDFPPSARTWCTRHYGYWQRTGDPLGEVRGSAKRALSRAELVKLRRLVGLPDDGPNAGHQNVWRQQENPAEEASA